ncbi:MAG: methyltransferase domain-containing protein [Thermoleophilia bacterium]|nr:methyltransferase domain-containing protein [Thermoleophilia bacterium]
MSDHIHRSHVRVSSGFSEIASDYDDAVRFNVEGAQRLVTSIPPGEYDRILDVGCGTGFSTRAAIDRFSPSHVTAVDPAEGMLEQFRARFADTTDVQIDIVKADVESMPVPEASYDLVISSMAYHWFPHKWEAAKAMARAMKPGAVVAILMSGRGGEQAYRDVISNIEPINYRWLGAFDGNLRNCEEMDDYLTGAGLEPIDVWMETRTRYVPVEAYMERMRVVAGHMIGDQSEADVADYVAKIEAELRRRSGPRGWRYEFAKLFALARKPG